MAYASLFLLASWGVLAARKASNRYTWLFGLLIVSVNLMIFSLLSSTAKIGNYATPIADNVFYYDQRIYLGLTRFFGYYEQIFEIGNLGAAAFICSVASFAFAFLANTRDYPRGARLRGYLGLVLFPALYLALSAPEAKYRAYIWYFGAGAAERPARLRLLASANACMTFFVFAYLAFPVASFWLCHRASVSIYKRHQTLMLGISIVLLELVFAFLYFAGPVRRFFANDVDLQCFLLNQAWANKSLFLVYAALPALILAAMTTILVTLLFLGGLSSFTKMIPRRLAKQGFEYDDNLRGVFHSFKNTFFAYSTILAEMKDAGCDEPTAGNIRLLEKLNDENLRSVADALDSLRSPRPFAMRTDVHEALRGALAGLEPVAGIEVRLPAAKGECGVFFSEFQLIEIFRNLLRNAQESIVASGRQDGLISIEILQDDNAVVAQVRDNGVGIARRVRRRIFEPFFSTKKSGKNWGLGLSFVAKSVAAHGGLIYMKSKPGEFCVFEVLMYAARRRDAA